MKPGVYDQVSDLSCGNARCWLVGKLVSCFPLNYILNSQYHSEKGFYFDKR